VATFKYLKTLILLFCGFTIIFFINCIPDYFDTIRTNCVLRPCSTLAPAPPTTIKALQVYHLTPDTYSLWFVLIESAFALIFYTAAVIIFLKSKRDPLALLAMIALVGYGTTFTSLVYMGSAGWGQVPEVIAAVGRLALFLFLLLFPNGKPAPRWTILPYVPFAIVQVISLIFPQTGWDLLNWSGTSRLVYYLTMIATVIFSQIYRYRKISTSVERQQTKWVVYGVTVSFIGSIVASGFFVYPVFADNPLSYIYLSALLYTIVSVIPITLALAILRKRLWEIDPLVNRTILYGVLSLSIILIYAVLILYLSNLFKTEGNYLISFFSTAVVAILFSPLKERLQRIVNRLLKGRHDDPYSVLRELGDHLSKPLRHEEMLRVAAESIKAALRLPYAAISLNVAEDEKMAVEAGKAAYDLHYLPIVHGGEELGTLMVSSRSPDEAFTADDRRLLDVLIRQAGPIVQNVKMNMGMELLAASLQESRERLVLAREEERLHIRRNLHDDLAPKLLSLSFNVAAAEQYVKKSPDQALALLGELRTVIRTTVDEIRTMVHDLRPPTLDEFGLLGSIQARIDDIQKTAADGFAVELIAPTQLPSLPAAVEVAAYRIITEALVNVLKHARASRCSVTININAGKELQITVADNGVGLPAVIKPSGKGGIGLKSMRERTAELGGQCFFEKIDSGGTRITALLPFANEVSNR
jgi:signal transduction histidine kinase